MTIKELLAKCGVDEQVIGTILQAMKDNRVFTSSEENLDVRYGKLKQDHESQGKQLEEANKLIEQMKQDTAGQGDLQAKISEYEKQVLSLQDQLAQTKIENAIKVGLLSSKALDVDYLTFKLREKLNRDGETMKLDESGNIVGWSDKVNGLKTQFPTMFTTDVDNSNGLQVFDPNLLKGDDGKETVVTKDTFRAMNYEQRLALKSKNEKLYKQLTSKG